MLGGNPAGEFPPVLGSELRTDAGSPIPLPPGNPDGAPGDCGGALLEGKLRAGPSVVPLPDTGLPEFAPKAGGLATGLDGSPPDRVPGGLPSAVESRSELASGEAPAGEVEGAEAGGFESGEDDGVTDGAFRCGSSPSESLDLRLAFSIAGLKPEPVRDGVASSNPEPRDVPDGLDADESSLPEPKAESGLDVSLAWKLPGGVAEGVSLPELASLNPEEPPGAAGRGCAGSESDRPVRTGGLTGGVLGLATTTGSAVSPPEEGG